MHDDKKLIFYVVGGDMRQIYLARQLKEDGHTVRTYAIDSAFAGEFIPGESEPCDVDCVVLPLPAMSDAEHISAPLSDIRVRAETVLGRLAPGTVVVAGKVTEELNRLAEMYELRLYDYFEREEMAVLNAVPTVEGACAIAMDELSVTLHGAKALVIGFGRIGKLLAHRLKGFGCDVTVAARKFSDLAWADAYGYSGVKTGDIGEFACRADVIFNTVPALVIDRGIIDNIRRDTLIIDLASKPGGAGLKLDKVKCLKRRAVSRPRQNTALHYTELYRVALSGFRFGFQFAYGAGDNNNALALGHSEL